MKKLHLLLTILLSVALAGLTACGEITWETFTSEQGGFSVQMPGTPKEETQSMDVGVSTMTLYLYTIQSGSSVYVASYAEIPEELLQFLDPETMLPLVAESAFGGIGGAIDDQREITLGEYTGLEATGTATFEGIEATIRGRFFIVDNKLYQLFAAVPSGQSTDDVDTFLNSFSLLEAEAHSQDHVNVALTAYHPLP